MHLPAAWQGLMTFRWFLSHESCPCKGHHLSAAEEDFQNAYGPAKPVHHHPLFTATPPVPTPQRVGCSGPLPHGQFALAPTSNHMLQTQLLADQPPDLLSSHPLRQPATPLSTGYGSPYPVLCHFRNPFKVQLGDQTDAVSTHHLKVAYLSAGTPWSNSRAICVATAANASLPAVPQQQQFVSQPLPRPRACCMMFQLPVPSATS